MCPIDLPADPTGHEIQVPGDWAELMELLELATGHVEPCAQLTRTLLTRSVLQVKGAPDVAQRNTAGQSIEDLAEAHMLKAELADR